MSSDVATLRSGKECQELPNAKDGKKNEVNKNFRFNFVSSNSGFRKSEGEQKNSGERKKQIERQFYS